MHGDKFSADSGCLQADVSSPGESDMDSLGRGLHVPLRPALQPDQHAVGSVLGLRVERDHERDKRGHIYPDAGCQQRDVHGINPMTKHYGMVLEAGRYKLQLEGIK